MFKYFPDNYMWSLGFLRCLNSGGLLGEMHPVGQRLLDASKQPPAGDLEAWHVEWYRLGEKVERIGEAALAAGHKLAARDGYYRAAAYYQWSEAFLPSGDPRKNPTNRKHLDCFHQAGRLMDPALEFVDVPYVDGPLPAYLVPAAPGLSKPGPAVVFFDGLDGNKEEFFPMAAAIAARGIPCLVVDGPGQGEALKLRGIVSRPDYEVAGAAAYDYLAARPEVDPQRIGVLALSMGGYYAPRIAAGDHRYKACVAWGAIYDYREAWIRRMNIQPGTPIAAPAHHLFDVLGAKNWDEALEILKGFSLRGVAKNIECDFLLVHGEDDRQIPLADAQALFDEVGSKRKEFKIFTVAEGGGSHCQVDQPEPCRGFIADWLVAHL